MTRRCCCALAAAAARANAPIAAGTMARLAERAPELRKPWPRPALDALFSLLAAGPGLVDVVEAFDRTGLWGRLFPEWGAVRDLPPRDAVHLWTVDRHLVQTTVQAAALATTVARPDLLLLGALLHDIGKGRDADHSVVGAALAAQIGERARPARRRRGDAVRAWSATTCCCRTPRPAATSTTRPPCCASPTPWTATGCCWTCSTR